MITDYDKEQTIWSLGAATEEQRQFFTELLALCVRYKTNFGACSCCDGAHFSFEGDKADFNSVEIQGEVLALRRVDGR